MLALQPLLGYRHQRLRSYMGPARLTAMLQCQIPDFKHSVCEGLGLIARVVGLWHSSPCAWYISAETIHCHYVD